MPASCSGVFANSGERRQAACAPQINQRARLVAQKVRSIFASAFSRLFLSPLRDFAVVSAQQDFRNSPTTKLRRARVLRCLQQPFAKTVVVRALFVSVNTGEKPANCSRQNQSCGPAVRQHIIADGYFRVDQMVHYSMIDAFVMPADDNE